MSGEPTTNDRTLAGEEDSANVIEVPRRRGDAPMRLGRFVVLSQLGRGAMGVVCAAYGPELERKVALKLLRTLSARSEERAVREAQAMAKLTHPHVVQVYVEAWLLEHPEP